ncbi:protoplast secreted protein 2 [[Candida] jaroonii]|uniref:Protoplast secreted protein 2 n=1 Tax=[Candida] jaroonii TaxID=467808 RepID=A0ACA9Y4J0_9ASCO|nr:protoplast secreted protein 2 [[Candida] jaroonii]
MVKIAIIYYSTWGHAAGNAKELLKGVQEAGGDADIYQVPETLSEEVLGKMYAPPKDASVPEITVDKLTEYDAFLFVIPTRFGNFPAQWKTFWDQTGGLWATGGLHGKPFGVSVVTSSPGGGQETTIINSLSSFIHHGMIYVPLGYGEAFPLLTNLDEVHGASPWGSGSFSAPDGSRATNDLEKKILNVHGKSFYTAVQKF